MKKNTMEILKNVEHLIDNAETISSKRGYRFKYYIDDVCDELSIFDWWNETLSINQLKQMKSFLETAHKMGYDGYVCFKVGAKYCSNGMWAHKEESTTGYSPDGECLYHSFVTGRNDWDAKLADGTWLHDKADSFGMTLKEVRAMI